MPSFSAPSSIRIASQDHALRLKVTHNLVHASPSDAVHSFKGRLPKELDVLWLSDISISLSGSLDGHQMPAHDIVRSGLVHHLQMQLKANADRLGLNNVSRPFVDDADGLSKLTLTPSRPLPYASRPHANLVSLHLAYIWRTVARRSGIAGSGHLAQETNPFSPTLFLPVEALLNRLTQQFLIYHLASRYPLIFGPWCKRLDLEMQYFPSIGHSVVEIMTRSENHGFRSKCKRLLKIARRQHKFVLQTCAAALSSCMDAAAAAEILEQEMDDLLATPVLTDEQVLCASLEQLFRVGVPQRRFKPVATPQSVSLLQDDDDGLLQCMPDVGIDDRDPWVELPEIAMSPCALLTDSYETLPEDVDVFAEEGRSEGGIWRLDELGGRKVDAQSDGSLISGSTSLAGITTPFALYHHLDVDHREPDPGASGLGYKVSQLACVEDPGTPSQFANLIHLPSHGHHYSEDGGQLMQGTGTPGGFETEGDEVSMLFDLDEPDVTTFEEPLV